MNNMMAVVEARCSVDPEGEAAFRFIAEWIDVSLEMGLDPDYVGRVQQSLMEETQEALF